MKLKYHILISAISLITLLSLSFISVSCVKYFKSDKDKIKKPQQNQPIPPPKRDVPGKRFTLSIGQLYIPDFFDPALTETTEAITFFHGAAWCSEQTFYDGRKNAVLVSISLKDCSELLADPNVFSKLIEETAKKLADEGITSKPIGKICIASFSGGYIAIREILKHKEFQNLITDVVLADSLYAPRLEGKLNTIDPEAMKPFLDYAQRAASGECTFIFSQLYPPKKKHRDNTTTLTAAYLIEKIGAKRTYPKSTYSSRKAKILYRADKGNFHILGYSGMTTQDHFEHFYGIADLYRETSLTNAKNK